MVWSVGGAIVVGAAPRSVAGCPDCSYVRRILFQTVCGDLGRLLRYQSVVFPDVPQPSIAIALRVNDVDGRFQLVDPDKFSPP